MLNSSKRPYALLERIPVFACTLEDYLAAEVKPTAIGIVRVDNDAAASNIVQAVLPGHKVKMWYCDYGCGDIGFFICKTLPLPCD